MSLESGLRDSLIEDDDPRVGDTSTGRDRATEGRENGKGREGEIRKELHREKNSVSNKKPRGSKAGDCRLSMFSEKLM